MRKLAAVFALLCNLAPVLPAQRREAYDVVIIGATPAGIAAAIQAGRAKLSVALVEETPVPGGLLSSGVSRADDAMVQSVSGVFEEFRRRVASYYRTTFADDPVIKAHLATPRIRHNVAMGQAWEPKVAVKIYSEMLAELPTIQVYYREIPVGAKLEGQRVVAVVTKDTQRVEHIYRGRAIIDATYEGDVAAYAGVPYSVGREPRSAEEPHAGEIYTDAFCEGAYQLPGTILPGGSGRGDKKIMAYNYRFLVKDYGSPAGPHLIKTPPPNYDPARYKWTPIKPYLPNGKVDVLGINWGNDWAGPSYAYPEATWEERKKIGEQYRDHAMGFLYYIQTEGKQPNFGLADDEFTDNGNFPYRLYVREARRIEGLYRLSESDMHKDLRGNGLRGPLHRDSIAIGLYEMDSHNVQNPVNRESRCSGEGAINLVDVTGPYQIPYGVLVPKNREGLLVPVAISSTHVAMASVRMEPVWSALGEAAGAAAVLSLKSGTPFRDLNVTALQQQLLESGEKLFFYQDVDAATPHYAAIQKMSLLGAVDGDENYRFHPERAITIGQVARLLVMGFDIPLSITGSHFRDAPRGHEAFKFIETLYDASTSSGHPFLPFEVRQYLSYAAYKDSNAYVYPDAPATTKVFRALVEGALIRKGLSLGAVQFKAEPNGIVSRAEACAAIAAIRSSLSLGD